MAVNYPSGYDDSTSLLVPVNATSERSLETTLTAQLLSGDTSAAVADALGPGFASSYGVLSIDDELIIYSGRTSTSFTGLTRGAFGTSAVGHAEGATVAAYMVAGFIQRLQEAVVAIEQVIGVSGSYNFQEAGSVVPVGSDLPDETGQEGKFLKTSGVTGSPAVGTAAWAAIAISDVTGLQTALDAKAASTHSHVISDVTGLQTALDAKLPLAGGTLTGNLTIQTGVADVGLILSSTIANSGKYVLTQRSGSGYRWAFGDLGGNETGSDAGSNFGIRRWTDAQVATDIFTISRATGVANFAYTPTVGGTAVSVVGHAHAISDVTGLQAALDGKAASTHAHAAGDITSGTFADARVAQSNVTQHQAALAIAHTQVSGLGGAAVLNVGTGAGTVAGGNHTHDGVYEPVLPSKVVSAAKYLKLTPASPTSNPGTLSFADVTDFAAASHNHDTDYYTKSAVDALLENYAPVAPPGDEYTYLSTHLALEARVQDLENLAHSHP